MNKMSSKLPPRYYEMPPRFRECFYLANASFFDSVNWYVHKAYEIIFSELVDKLMSFSGLDEQQASNKISNIIKVLDQCNSLLDIRYPLKKEDGSLELIRSFTVNHGALLGNTLSLGGLRISPHITRDEMKGLSVLSTHRLSALGIRATGAFGGLKINSNEYSPEEMKSIIKNISA
ncbi:hypothetical protein HHI36_016174 [Cryptolaemus montrouzieri]|uniref:Glutamate/phenylalanine/leucine/valine/L-tryptophan dehydrogenase dimerisation domain-containing protein n=1 Tax=Cryptolaemus montrouzieri TaxID=559131 RepID=A0ABD2NJ53_9CUCU